jgi:thiol:disulfide interchange protein DsbC
MVVFADPNCGYCKRLESDLNGVKNITVYTFLYPILGGDSADKSRAIWCSKDNAKVWRSWMLDNKQPAQVMGKCDSSAIDRNVALGRKHGVNGTPSMVFVSGERVPGVISLEELEKKFATVPGLAARY